jgi:hypothetical protein
MKRAIVIHRRIRAAIKLWVLHFHIPQNIGGGPGRLAAIGQGREGGGVGERLDGTAGLLQGEGDVDTAVNRLVVVIHAAQHRQNLAGGRFEGNQGGVVEIVFRADGVYVLPRQLFGQPLVAQIEGRGHLQAAVGHHISAELLFQKLPHVNGKVRRSQTDLLRREGERFLVSGFGLGLVNHAIANHQVEDEPLPLFGPVQVGEGVQFHRALR